MIINSASKRTRIPMQMLMRPDQVIRRRKTAQQTILPVQSTKHENTIFPAWETKEIDDDQQSGRAGEYLDFKKNALTEVQTIRQQELSARVARLESYLSSNNVLLVKTPHNWTLSSFVESFIVRNF